MSTSDRNPFLDSICTSLRRSRPPAPVTLDFLSRVETVLGLPFVSLWFRTRGCRHDARGGCTMCNYGASTAVSEDQMVDSVRRGLAALQSHGDMTLLLSPSGSMFDDREVPPRAREAIFRLAQETRMRAILCETRADTVTETGLRELAALFDDREASIGVGLESANTWILKYCINKGLSLQDYRSAVVAARACGITSTANVLLGAPFLGEEECIADTVGSIRWALSQGVESCVVFPSHVKRYTLLHWLWQRDMYSPPSLWSLVEVLSRVGPRLTPRVTISWYKDYYAGRTPTDPAQDSSFLCSPTTCPKCREAVMALLDDYRGRGDFETIRELAHFDCDCRHRWRSALASPVVEPLPERVAKAYEAVGLETLGEEWWSRNGCSILDGLRER